MARLCRSFQAYSSFNSENREQKSDESGFGVKSRSNSKEFIDQNENEKEKIGDSLSLSFESLVESTPVSNSTVEVEQNSNHTFCTDNGLRSCTESLGFEREDCGGYAQESAAIDDDCRRELDAVEDGGIFRRTHGHMGAKKWDSCFPPLLSSMGPNGQPSVFLKPLRNDGRFLLQEVKLPRHERMHAWRQDGRLPLQLLIPYASDQPSSSPDDVIKTDTCTRSERDSETGLPRWRRRAPTWNAFVAGLLLTRRWRSIRSH